MKERQISIEDLPAPGEPITPAIDENNQQLLEEARSERAALMAARLTKRQIKQLQKRRAWLHKRLNNSGYNSLIQRRWETNQRYEMLKHQFAKVKGQQRVALADQGNATAQEGRLLNEAIARLQPWADEFETINQRMNGHAAALAWEVEDAANRAAFLRESKVWEQQIRAVFRQSARLHHSWVDAKGNHQTTIPQIEQIVFKDDRVMYQIRITGQNMIERLMNKWHSALPYDVDIADLSHEETLENLSAACNRTVTVERSKRGTNFFYVISRLDSPDGIPKKVLYSKVIDWYPVDQHAKTPWAAGVTNDRKAEFFNFEDYPHVLIAGSTKSGKSNHVNQMLATLVTMNTPAEVRLLLVDNKGGIEFTHWSGIKHALRPMIKTVSEVLPALQFMRRIMERRLARFEQIKAKNLASYNDKVKQNEKLPRLIIVIDEMATLQGLGELTTEIQNELRVISSQGRAVGIHLIIATQHASVDVLPGWVKTNMTMRISGKMPSHQASMVILDSVTAATLPPVPGRLVFSQGRVETVAQSPFISDDEISRAVKLSKDFPTPDNTEFDETAANTDAPKERFSRDDFLAMALDSFNGKLAPDRIFDVVGNEVAPLRRLRFMRDDIVESASKNNGLDFRGVHYTLKKVGSGYVMQADKQAGEQNEAEPEAITDPLDRETEGV